MVAASPRDPDFLRIPSFPGAKVRRFAPAENRIDVPSRSELIDALRKNRVGGDYWTPTPSPREHVVLLREPSLADLAQSVARRIGVPVLPSFASAPGSDSDLWTLLAKSEAVVCSRADPARGIAALLEIPAHTKESGEADGEGLEALEATLAGQAALLNPFDGQPMGLLATIELCGFWRRLVEANRGLVGALGFAFWKQGSVAPLLWEGGSPLPFWRKAPADMPTGSVAIWRSRAPMEELAKLERRGTSLVEVEDGFLRSAGLGADCVPPLSITVDRLGPYFDPARPSELENMLNDDTFDAALIDRSRALRSVIVKSGLGKYETGTALLPRFGGVRHHILVPGQVEDDRSVLTGGLGLSNLELLRRVRERNPDAFIIYKPHPDVEAGHRLGSVALQDSNLLADKVINDVSIAALLDMVDAVHVNTSLTGFEALLRGKPVTTLGVPFYAGWGLTHDLGPIPASRKRVRTLDELVAATLLVYPRYLDPMTGLPCPAEVVVKRLTENEVPSAGLTVRLRRLQGRATRILGKLFG